MLKVAPANHEVGSVMLLANKFVGVISVKCPYKYSLLMHCIKIKSRAKSLLNEQYAFVGGNIYFLCVLSCISEEA